MDYAEFLVGDFSRAVHEGKPLDEQVDEVEQFFFPDAQIVIRPDAASLIPKR